MPIENCAVSAGNSTQAHSIGDTAAIRAISAEVCRTRSATQRRRGQLASRAFVDGRNEVDAAVLGGMLSGPWLLGARVTRGVLVQVGALRDVRLFWPLREPLSDSEFARVEEVCGCWARLAGDARRCQLALEKSRQRKRSR